MDSTVQSFKTHSRHTVYSQQQPKSFNKEVTAENEPLQGGPDRLESTEDRLAWLTSTGKLIDEQLETWGSASLSHHPALFHGGLARHIVKQCTYQQEDVVRTARNEPSPFELQSDLTRHKHKKAKKAEYNRDSLLRITTDDTLDLIEVESPDFSEYFSRIAAWQQNPNTPEEFRIATRCLYRLYVQRQEIAKERHRPDFDSTDFAFVLLRLVNDL